VRVNRRRFLQGCAAASVGYWIGISQHATRAEPANEKLHIAVIGCGNRGAANIRAVSSQNIVALCDVDERSAAQAFNEFPKAKKYFDFRRMFDELHQQIDAVVVSTPDHTHAPASVLAMKLGKHVYCEKPLCHSIFEARVMAETAGKMKVATQMGNQHHWGYRRVVEIVRSGVLGTIREVHAWSDRKFSGGERPQDKPPVPSHLHWDEWLGPAPERPYHPAYHPFRWRGWWDFGTGSLGDMGCHILDAAVWALALDKALSITVETEGPPVHPESTPPWLIVRYTFPARGDLPSISLTWYDGGKLPPPEVTSNLKLPSNGSLFVGEKGKLLVPHGGQPSFLPEGLADDFRSVAAKVAIPAPTEGHHGEWLQACKSGQIPGSHFGYAARLTEIVLLGNVAYRVGPGRKIEWDVATMRAKNCSEAERFVRREYRRGWSL
jgi:predicted dehydrogenase